MGRSNFERHSLPQWPPPKLSPSFEKASNVFLSRAHKSHFYGIQTMKEQWNVQCAHSVGRNSKARLATLPSFQKRTFTELFTDAELRARDADLRLPICSRRKK